MRACLGHWNRSEITHYTNGKKQWEFLQKINVSWNLDFSHNRRDTCDYDTPKISSYIGLSSTLWPKWSSARARKVFAPLFTLGALFVGENEWIKLIIFAQWWPHMWCARIKEKFNWPTNTLAGPIDYVTRARPCNSLRKAQITKFFKGTCPYNIKTDPKT